MEYREFGNTGIKVSEIGLGAWQLANPDWGANDTTEALQIVQKSLEAGCTFFDTAPGYNHGKSEEFLGQALKGHRKNVIISSKFGHKVDGSSDFSTQAIRPSVEGSLKRLQTDYLDILLLHNPAREMMDGRFNDQYEELGKLKQEGKIREYGISLDWRVELETMVATTHCKASEVLYNAFHQETGGAFAAAQAAGVGLIVKVPLDSGWLSGKYKSTTHFSDIRSRWTPEILERRFALLEKFSSLVPSGMSMSHTALRFILAQKEVSTVIPGAKTVDQALDNFAASEKKLDPVVVQAIESLWKSEIDGNPLPW
jgi:aryl-alcohol dehydrogenase-like predicted oxidoreductase